jgi:ABC-type nitrate/sulfonate/bicarbonate transport system substrate-binding protein
VLNAKRETNPHTAHKVENLRQLSVRLGWQVNANSIGQIVALEKGYYQEEGLKVTLQPGGLTHPSTASVSSGADQIGFANHPMLVFKARNNGAPLRILSIVQQKGYHAFFSRAEDNLQSPENWKNSRIGVKYASPTYLSYYALLSKFKLEHITEIPLQYGIQQFLDGDIDIYPGALTNEGIILSRLVEDLVVTKPEEYGFSTMGNVIFATEEFIGSEHDTVISFLRATSRGWDWALNPVNEDEALSILLNYCRNPDIEKERTALEINRKLAGNSALSEANIYKLNQIFNQMREYDLINDQLSFEDTIWRVEDYMNRKGNNH